MLFLPREEGQGMVEYSLLLVLIAVVIIATLALLGPQVAQLFTRVTDALSP